MSDPSLPIPRTTRLPVRETGTTAARLEIALRKSDIALLDWDLTTGELTVTPGWARQLGYPERDLPNEFEEWFSLIHPADRDAVRATVAEFCSRSWNDARMELRMRHRDGSYRCFLVQGSAITDEQGHTRRIVAERVDITERRRSEALIDGQARILERIVAGASLTTTLDRVARLIEDQDPAVLASVLLLEPDGVHLRHAAAPNLPASYTAAIDGIAVGEGVGSCGTAAFRGAPVLVADIASDPLWKDFRGLALAHGLAACWSTPILAADRKVLGTFALYFREPRLPDEHHRHGVEVATHVAALAILHDREAQALRASESRLAVAQTQAGLGSWELDVSSGTGTWSAEMYRLFDRDPGLGPPTLREFLEMVDPQDRAHVRLQSSDALQGGGLKRFEFRGVPLHGACRHFEAVLSAVSTESAQSPRLVGTVLDVTARRRAEIEARERDAQRLHAQKLESLGRLAAGVAHDFNNVLTVITAVTELALSGMTPPERLQADLSAIAEATQRGVEITRQLLAFAHKQDSSPIALDANQGIRSLLRMLRRLVGEDVSIDTCLCDGDATLVIDPAHLDQILVNLVTNARDAIEGPGSISIQTEIAALSADDVRKPESVCAGEYVLIRVSDSGAGIDDSVRSRIFEPFFTTKNRDAGTGLGLALVAQLVDQYRGFIDVRSVPGIETCFTLFFPHCAQPPKGIAAPPPARAVSGAETILIAEDDATLLQLVKRALESFGYRVIAAASAGDALAASCAETGRIALLLSDTVMPLMDGKQLFQELKKQHPESAVLFMSGYPLDELVRRNLLGADDPFLQKPFTPSTLITQIRERLKP